MKTTLQHTYFCLIIFMLYSCMAVKRLQYNLGGNPRTSPALVQSQVAEPSKEEKIKTMMNSWIGVTKHQLLLKWGVPSKTASDGNGGEILLFEHLGRLTSPYGQLVTIIQSYSFYIDKDQKIYNWKYDKQGREGH